jgi:ubiquinone/menaquinone biosynthesis C-methylase UbiE
LIVPSVADNVAMWDRWYDWPAGGEEWSAAWGGSEAQWHGTLLPRIGGFLPASTILEIAPGFGRWTHYLREHCDRLVLVDLSTRCIDACRHRFAGDDRIAYHVNDGRSLPGIEDASVDFAFSYDSLVHAEADVLASYLRELARVLTPEGIAFLHHSNAGEYRRTYEAVRRGPRALRTRLVERGWLDRLHRRALSVNAESFRASCEAAGLRCVTQELVNWGGRRLIDCFSTVVPAAAAARPTTVVRNHGFMDEAARVRARLGTESEGTVSASAR